MVVDPVAVVTLTLYPCVTRVLHVHPLTATTEALMELTAEKVLVLVYCVLQQVSRGIESLLTLPRHRMKAAAGPCLTIST